MTYSELIAGLQQRNYSVSDLGDLVLVDAPWGERISVTLSSADHAVVVRHDHDGSELGRTPVKIGPDEDSRSAAMNRIACTVADFYRTAATWVRPRRRRIA